jgi:UDP-glucuronate 4-epimerase
MAYSYSHLYSLPTTGLRFFTVYGPWGRPDMAMFLFTKAILAEQPINVFNYGRMKRDFTYIDDVIEGVIRVMDKIPLQSAASDHLIPNKIYNIGNNQPIELMQLIESLETCLGKKAVKNMLPMQPEEVPVTYADVEDLMADVGFRPNTPLEVGIERFVTWYRSYYQV